MTARRFQLKRWLKTSPFALAFVLFPGVGLALEVKDVPNPRQINGTWVTDMAGMLDEPTEAQLNSLISQLERKNGTEIAVVTVPETTPSASPRKFTTKLFNYWKIGKKGRDNGALLLISKSDRRVAIETGYGMEAILPDAKVANIINTQITPRFKQGDFDGGTLAGTKALVVAMEKPQATISTSQTFLPTQSSTVSQEVTQDDDFPWVPLVGGGVLLGGGLVLAIAKRRSQQRFAATHDAKRRQRRGVVKPSGYTSQVSSSHCYSQPHNHVHSGSRHVDVDVDFDVDIDVDVDSDDGDNSDRTDWSHQLDSCESSNDDSDSSWNSDSSDSSSSWNSDSHDSSWSSDSSDSCSSYDSSSSSDYGGGSSGGGGADGSW
ncbi:TPM domain-containing protein [Microcoleus sp. ZQ-A2]|nr:TPM domain-containing protein [Microcoleus sp. FACHB-1]